MLYIYVIGASCPCFNDGQLFTVNEYGRLITTNESKLALGVSVDRKIIVSVDNIKVDMTYLYDDNSKRNIVAV